MLASQAEWHLQRSTQQAHSSSREFVAIYLTLLVILTTKVHVFEEKNSANVFNISIENTFCCPNFASFPHYSGSIKVRHIASQSPLPCHARDLRPLYTPLARQHYTGLDHEVGLG